MRNAMATPICPLTEILCVFYFDAADTLWKFFTRIRVERQNFAA